MGLVFSISNFFINKIYQANKLTVNKLSAEKIPFCANPALVSAIKSKCLELVGVWQLFLKLLLIFQPIRGRLYI